MIAWWVGENGLNELTMLTGTGQTSSELVNDSLLSEDLFIDDSTKRSWRIFITRASPSCRSVTYKQTK